MTDRRAMAPILSFSLRSGMLEFGGFTKTAPGWLSTLDLRGGSLILLARLGVNFSCWVLVQKCPFWMQVLEQQLHSFVPQQRKVYQSWPAVVTWNEDDDDLQKVFIHAGPLWNRGGFPGLNSSHLLGTPLIMLLRGEWLLRWKNVSARETLKHFNDASCS